MNKRTLFVAALFFQSLSAFADGSGNAEVDRHMQAGNDALAAQRYQVAWQEFEQATKLDATNVQAWQALADVCSRMNKWAPAIDATEHVYQLLPDDAAAAQTLLDAYIKFAQHAKAAELGKNILKQRPEAPGVHFAVGKALHAQRNYGQALPYLEQAVAKDRKNAEAAYLAGRMCINMGNDRKALQYYDLAMALEPAHAMRAYEYALVLSTTGQFQDAIVWFEKTLKLGYQANDEFYLNMANAYTDAGQSARGIAALEELLTKRPGDMNILTALSEAYNHAHQYARSVSCLEEIYKADPSNARALYQVGMAYIKMGKEAKGKAICDQAIEQDPSLASLRQQKSMF